MDLKNILIYLPEFPVLTETFIARDLAGLVRSGKFNIKILALLKGTGEFPENLKSVVSYQKLTLTDCLLGFLKYALLRPQKLLKAFFLIVGKDRVPFLIPGKRDIEQHSSFKSKLFLTRFSLFLKGIAYANVFAGHHPDEIIVHFAGSSSTIVMVSATLLNIPYTVWAHARDVAVDGSLFRSKIRSAKSVIVCNKFAYDKFLQSSGQADNVVLQHHGVDYAHFENYKSTLPKLEKQLILSIGRLVEKKGMYFLIRAAEILKARGYDFYVYVIGAGSLYDRLLSAIDKHDLRNVVKILGDGKGLPFKEVINYLGIADVFVFPGVEAEDEDFDGIANTLIEASLMKIPSVVTTAGSNTELIKNNVNGLVVGQKDPEQIADALEKLLKDSKLRQSLGQKAHESAKDMFDMDKAISNIESLLQ